MSKQPTPSSRPKKSRASRPAPGPSAIGVANHALYGFLLIRERLMVKAASAIHERHWTQAQAAAFLGVSQPRISDLMRAKASKFTVDMLIHWLLALGKEVHIDVTDSGERAKTAPVESAKNDDALEAIRFFTGAILLDPRDVASYQNRGDQYMVLKQFDLAIGDYTRAAELAPDRPGPRNQRALAYQASGQLKAAMQEAEDLIRLWPEYSYGYAQRGRTYFLMRDFEKSLADYSKNIEMEPDRPGPYLNRANIYMELGQFQKAVADFDEILRINPALGFAREARDNADKKILPS